MNLELSTPFKMIAAGVLARACKEPGHYTRRPCRAIPLPLRALFYSARRKTVFYDSFEQLSQPLPFSHNSKIRRLQNVFNCR